MNPQIIGIGTATPLHVASQSDSLKMFQDIVCQTERQRRLARELFRKSGVKQRHFVIPYKAAYTWCGPAEVAAGAVAEGETSAPMPARITEPKVLPEVIAGNSPGASTAERMEIYTHFASDLATESAANALEDSQVRPDQITHLVTVTCTGFDSPGVDFELIKRLELPNTTQRINVGFMGCHAAINGIRVAQAIATADSSARVLVCCVELCSLHYRFQWDNEGIIGNALFADGSASLVIGQQSPTEQSARQQPQWNLIDTGSVVIAESQSSMSWKVGNHGFEMMLASEVGEKIEANLAAWLTHWLDKRGLSVGDVDYWAVHPGGPKILDAVQSCMHLSKDALNTSRSVLESHGNMSSPTVLFVLQQFQYQQINSGSGNALCLLLAFGPGLVAEVALISVESQSPV